MKTSIRDIARFLLACILLCGLFGPTTAWASEGNIDSSNKYAWSENSGWLNHRPTNGGVTVHDTYLSGYAWAENIGWVKLGSGTGPYDNNSSTNWGVNRNSGTGALSGYAWSENAGWINFNSTNSQVIINTSTGSFDGYAWSENAGWIHFKCDDPTYNVAVSTPTITSFSPTSGGTNTSVTITGANFTGATAVKFGGTAASSFTVNSSTRITAIVGGGSDGKVTVTTPGNTATSSSDFTYAAVAAGTYYVDITDGNDSNAGSSAAPWKTLHHAIDQINGGGSGTYILIMAAGTYKIDNGEVDTAITLSQDNVTIIGTHDLSIGASNISTFIDGTDATTWAKGIEVTGSNITIKELSITAFSGTDKYGIAISAGSGNEVLSCKIYENNTGIEITNSSAFKIRGCEIYSNTTDGLNVTSSTDGEIYRNTIYLHQDADADGVYVHNCSPAIKRNKIYDNKTGIRVQADNGNTASPAIGNNVIYETTDYTMNYGILVKADTNATASPAIHHNSIDGGTGDGIATENISTGGTLAPVIKYNIITRNDTYGIDAVANTCTINYNDVWHNGPDGRGLATDNYNGCDPGANDLTSGDGLGKDPKNGVASELASNSPCIDAIPTAAGDDAIMDYPGYKRPKGSGYDMGAYEYIATQTYTDTLPGGTGVVTDYRIFTVPLDTGAGLVMREFMEVILGLYDPTHWRVFARTTSGDIEINTQAFASLDIKPGMGFWGITLYTGTVSYQGTLSPDAIYYRIELEPGWHLFAVPWPNTSIELGKIYVTDGVNEYTITNASNTLTEQKIWDYTGSGPDSGYVQRIADDFSLVDGTGYFIKVLGSSNIILSIPPDNISDPPNNSSVSTSRAVRYESLESVRLIDDSEPPPLPDGSYGPMPDIKANGKSGPLTVSNGTPVSITISLDPGDQADKKADWWVVAHTPFAPPLDWYSYVYPKSWQPGIHVCVQMPPFQLPPSFEVLNMALPAGDYTFYFAIDENADGLVDETWKDSVDVRVE